MTARAGMERILYNKALLLSQIYGHEVYIVMTDKEKAPCLFDETEKIRFLDLDVNYYKAFLNKNIIKKYYEIKKCQRNHKNKLKDVLLRIKPDVIISLGDLDEWIIPSVSGNIPTINECHFHYSYRIDWNHSIYQRIRLKLNRYLKSKFKVFVVLTEADRKAWKLKNCIAIPNFSLLKNKNSGDKRERKAIAVGRLTFQKGFDQLIEIWSRLVEENGEKNIWPLEIYGSGEDEKLLRDLIKEKHLENKVSLKGNVSNIANIYNTSSILAVTSRYEGFPLSIIEGMSCGVVPVSFDCKQGPSEIITKHSGFILKQGDLDGFADAILELMNDENKLNQMSACAIERADQFSPEIVIKRWNDLFNNLVADVG